MKAESVRIAEIKANSDNLRELLHNPVVELLAGIVVISYLNKGSQSLLEKMTGIDLAAGGEFAGLIAVIGLQQLAPLAPSIAQGTESIAKALPALLALGA
jgi:hypothetical protein